MTDPAVRTYQLDEPVRCSYAHPILGEIVCEFPAGVVQPKSEGEELVLEHQLCPIGLATVVDEGIAPWGLSAGKFDAGDVTVADGPPEDVTAGDGVAGDDTPKPGSREALAAEARDLGLDDSGTKADLKARIAEAHEPAGGAGETPEGDA